MVEARVQEYVESAFAEIQRKERAPAAPVVETASDKGTERLVKLYRDLEGQTDVMNQIVSEFSGTLF